MDKEREELRAAGQVPDRQPCELRESIEYSWCWCVANTVLSRGPSEIVTVILVPSGSTTDSAIYDGVDANGVLVGTLVAAVAAPWQFSPRVPIYCRSGIYVDFGTAVTGIFVQWRELGRRGP